MEYFCFVLKSKTAVDSAWETLKQAGFKLLYSSEEPECAKLIYGYPPEGYVHENLLSSFPELAAFYPVQFEQINWHDQWGSESSSISIDLSQYSQGLKNGFLMSPGPGFGDLSHPTTKIALRMMAPLVAGKFVVDVGCGSGVLSLAALKLGAKSVCGIDIDPEALIHAKQNAALNHIEENITFQLPSQSIVIPVGIPILLVMNMIYTEQEQAWNSLPQLHSLKMESITTGVLKQHQKLYLALCQKKGWRLYDRAFEEKWCGFHFVMV